MICCSCVIFHNLGQVLFSFYVLRSLNKKFRTNLFRSHAVLTIHFSLLRDFPLLIVIGKDMIVLLKMIYGCQVSPSKWLCHLLVIKYNPECIHHGDFILNVAYQTYNQNWTEAWVQSNCPQILPVW